MNCKFWGESRASAVLRFHCETKTPYAQKAKPKLMFRLQSNSTQCVLLGYESSRSVTVQCVDMLPLLMSHQSYWTGLTEVFCVTEAFFALFPCSGCLAACFKGFSPNPASLSPWVWACQLLAEWHTALSICFFMPGVPLIWKNLSPKHSDRHKLTPLTEGRHLESEGQGICR